ncbi:hypothetical protein [Paenibacillus sp. GSMTC-2017]|uniref:hypothetical protein n=1 Tax=Paenibacillus sp. GSMTC-2017 TaxID=2794350 RepID=UPI001E31FD92|nr:hypothetical protein [Paenibacillus sp. GSMTC-2017]
MTFNLLSKLFVNMLKQDKSELGWNVYDEIKGVILKVDYTHFAILKCLHPLLSYI